MITTLSPLLGLVFAAILQYCRNFGGPFIDATYADPLGEAPARPKTAGRQRPQQVEDEFGDEEIGDDLLPE